ncbi:DNA-formamidopyrimidine glycosylase family protein [Pinibacter soli]|uniref:Endonuclease n=1 Tax=Pinibacter soli TaxID=3044211 RepID=A0ABT6RAR2_9BACT|nr:DNA-formamidopyrimidine glycosylase family protein [Pinibacter soli]MDI3318974.1 endonuclease [Pinibacter soli]
MPEGPSIVILKEEVQAFKRKKIIAVSGNTTIDKERMLNQTVVDFKSWGKHFLICFKTFSLRIHFMLFGSYRINERKDAPVRLGLQFTKGEINFYTCSVQFVEGDVNDTYDWSVDVMSDEWSPTKARTKLKANPDMLVCDALLDQHIFSGVGNIIKNEVLFRIKVHPESKVGNLPPKKLSELIKEARVYCFQFLEWKKAFVLKTHWLAHTKKICPRSCSIHKKTFRQNTPQDVLL